MSRETYRELIIVNEKGNDEEHPHNNKQVPI